VAATEPLPSPKIKKKLEYLAVYGRASMGS